MKKSKMSEQEKTYVELYDVSKGVGEKANEAAELISHIDYCFRIIDAFTGQNHADIVHDIYFSANNILSSGVDKLSNKFYLPERTLYCYRQKYCETIANIVSLSEVAISKILIIDSNK